MKTAREKKLNPIIFNAVQYTRAELNKVEYFHMNVPYVTEQEGTYAADYEQNSLIPALSAESAESLKETAWLADEFSNNKISECGHRNVVYLRSDMQYDRESILNAADFNLTCEYLSSYRLQEIVVSRKVKKIFNHQKIYAGFNPVYIA